MKTAAVAFAALLVTVAPALAADPCPPELAKAREALKAAGATAQAMTQSADKAREALRLLEDGRR
jgi:hypothetical protein